MKDEILESFEEFSKENSLNEAVGKDVHRLVNNFIKKMADKYGYSLQDAVNATMSVLRSQNYDGLNEVILTEGNFRSEEERNAMAMMVSGGLYGVDYLKSFGGKLPSNVNKKDLTSLMKIAKKVKHLDAINAFQELYDTLNESTLNEARSDSSKIAKKTNMSKADVDSVQKAIDEMSLVELSVALANPTGLDENDIHKILKMMIKVYGGNLQITIK